MKILSRIYFVGSSMLLLSLDFNCVTSLRIILEFPTVLAGERWSQLTRFHVAWETQAKLRGPRLSVHQWRTSPLVVSWREEPQSIRYIRNSCCLFRGGPKKRVSVRVLICNLFSSYFKLLLLPQNSYILYYFLACAMLLRGLVLCKKQEFYPNQFFDHYLFYHFFVYLLPFAISNWRLDFNCSSKAPFRWPNPLIEGNFA